MTARDIYPRELLRLAERLAPRTVGRGRPRTVDLRQAVTTAYYALFHRVSRDVAIRATGHATTPEAHALVRWISHTELRTLAEAMATKPAAAVRRVIPVPSPDLEIVCRAFMALQDAREKASYDHEYDLSRALTVSLVAQARDAHDRTVRMIDADEPTYLAFLALALGSTKIAKNR